MAELKVERFYQGSFEPVGTLSSNNVFELIFTYDESYRSKPNAAPLSLSLPLSRAFFDTEETLPFFEGLLPEGPALESIARELHVSALAPLDLLRLLGAEAIGAVRIGEEEELRHIGSGYTLLTNEDIDLLSEKSELVAAGYLKKAKLSLAGAQHKVGLYANDDSLGIRSYFIPDGVAASTHIIKTVNRSFEGIVFNECYCAALARACGLPVPDTEIINAAQPMLAIKRFDRVINESCRIYDGLPGPLRLHQEDFSQALGIDLTKKYEAGDNDYPKLISELIRTASANPLKDIEALALSMVFNYLIGNCDNHLKNLSLLYSEDYQTIRLAPFYDVLCTTMYRLDREMGLRLGSTRLIDQVNREDFALLGSSIGVSPHRMLGLLDDMRERLDLALKSGIAEGQLGGYETADSVVHEISKGATARIKVVGVS